VAEALAIGDDKILVLRNSGAIRSLGSDQKKVVRRAIVRGKIVFQR
jgi:hypothetical protein